MEKGIVKWFSSEKGYGFLTSDVLGDVFVHWSGIAGDGFKTLEHDKGTTVEFDVERNEDGRLFAKNVVVIYEG